MGVGREGAALAVIEFRTLLYSLSWGRRPRVLFFALAFPPLELAECLGGSGIGMKPEENRKAKKRKIIIKKASFSLPFV
jgi:hypothetical protein